MKDIAVKLTLIIACIVLISSLFQQCSKTKALKKQIEVCGKEYSDLLKAKQKVDTVYVKGETQYVYKTVFKTLTDTLIVNEGLTYSWYLDTLKRPNLTLNAKILAHRLKAIEYDYNVTETIITKENIVYKHDTTYIDRKRMQLLITSDFGLNSYSAGLHLQTKQRWGVTAKWNLHAGEKYFTLGAAYRIF